MNLHAKLVSHNKTKTTKIKTIFGSTRSTPILGYFMRLTADYDLNKVLFVVHGVNRDPRSQIHLFAKEADRHGYSIIAPFFDVLEYPDYQRLGRAGLGSRADQALIRLLYELQCSHGLATKINLFGFSGGAQFAHRFALTHPELVGKLIIASAGWYTDLSSKHAFPFGTGSTPRLPDLACKPQDLAQTPICVVVGDQDTQRDSQFRVSKKLDRRQGQNRVERATWWYSRLQKLTKQTGANKDQHELHALPGIGHSFKKAVCDGGLDWVTFNFITKGLLR